MSRRILQSMVWVLTLLGCHASDPPRTPSSPAVAPSGSPTKAAAAAPEADPVVPPTPAPPPLPAPPAVDPEQFVASLEEAAEIHRPYTDGRCAGFAADVQAIRDEHAETLALADETVQRLVDQSDALKPRMQAAMGDIMTATLRCRGRG